MQHGRPKTKQTEAGCGLAFLATVFEFFLHSAKTVNMYSVAWMAQRMSLARLFIPPRVIFALGLFVIRLIFEQRYKPKQETRKCFLFPSSRVAGALPFVEGRVLLPLS